MNGLREDSALFGHHVDNRIEVIRNIVSERLQNLGLEKIRLPLGATETNPTLPIFVSSNLKTKKRVIILFYEHNQDLGIFAHRIIGGRGGINAGSAVDFVKYIQSMATSGDNHEAPGIILANMGQLWWWRQGRKAVTQTSWYALPQKSAVDRPYRFDEVKNRIPGNKNTEEHVNYIFNHVVEKLVNSGAKLSVVGVSEGATRVASFLENAENWKKWGNRMDALAGVATYYHASDIQNTEFAEWFRDVRIVLITLPGLADFDFTARSSVPDLPRTLRYLHSWPGWSQAYPWPWLPGLQLGRALL